MWQERVRRLGGAGWFVAALLVATVPCGVLAQGVVRYETLTVVEAAYLYSGLGLQAVLRRSSLRFLVPAIVMCGIFWLLYRRRMSAVPAPLFGVFAYVVHCLLILVMFWPEAAGGFGLQFQQLFPGAVTSHVAQGNSMLIQTAGQSGLIPAYLQTLGFARVPRALDLFLQGITQAPLRLGEAIDSAGLRRPFERLPVMRQLLVEEMPADLGAQLPRFAQACYAEAVRALQASATSALTRDQMMPWSSQMQTELGRIRIDPDKGFLQKLQDWLSSWGFSWGGGATISCDAFYNGIEHRIRRYLTDTTTASGMSHSALYDNAIDIQIDSQVQFYVNRELSKHVAPVVAAPSRVAAAAGVSSWWGTVTSAIGSVAGAIFGGGANPATAAAGAAGGAVVGAAAKFAGQVSALMGLAGFLVFWAPYLVGFALFTTLGLFPVVLLWSMFPGQHFKPLINYFLLLIFLCSTPLWWAVVNTTAELAYNSALPSGGFLEVLDALGGGLVQPGAWVVYMFVSSVGIVMVPMVQAILLFGTWRAIGGILRG